MTSLTALLISICSHSDADLPTEWWDPLSIVHGDIRNHVDLDYFRFDSIPDYVGNVTFEVRSRGVSQLCP